MISKTLLATILLAVVSQRVLASKACLEAYGGRTLPAVEFEKFHYDDHILANGIPVTGQHIYPLANVLRNLRLVQDPVELARKKTLSLGEGISLLLPYLLARGANAFALDLCYHSDEIPQNLIGRQMEKYTAKFGPRLIAGDALHLPMRARTYDLVLSHHLVNNHFSIEQQFTILREVIRVLKKGGEARIYGFGDEEIMEIQDFLEKEYGRKIDASLSVEPFAFTFNGQDNYWEHFLLKIKKH